MIWAAIKTFFAKPIWQAIGGALGRVPVWVWVALAGIALVLLYGHHREAQGRYEGRAEMQAKIDRAERAWAKELQAASVRYEQLAQSLRADERRDRETIREIYRERKVPADCAVPDAAVRLLDNAVGRANAAASGQSGG